ncbi:hypothetical protein IFM89_006877 [Coptis chinensis]|uniref:Uncharacterized protein n=1 Tax=Coptis chinensis TaxID=261450 RepID=A0A835GZH6_9MAGN|nr:hypothetical protein IFM89_006877 [Coptis chinensis]
MLYKRGDVVGEAIDCTGSNMLNRGENDGEYWIDLPDDDWNATIKFGMVNIPLSKVGQHVSDWEHFTQRVSNFSGELGVYTSDSTVVVNG